MLSTVRRPLSQFTQHVLGVVVAMAAVVASVALTAPSADAMTPGTRERVMHVAASKRGTPYRYGATGPRAFDCSGYARWVFARVGKRLPRTSRAQAGAVRRISRSSRRTGDLVFFRNHGRVYHVGIYAGRNTLWHAPRTGERVKRARIWTSAVTYGRVR
jgi:cell wall-associated NlpC family hydrolase